MHRRSFIACGLTAVCVTPLLGARGQSAAAQDPATVRKVLDDINAQIAQAFRTGDADKLFGFFAPDAMIVLGADCFAGASAIRQRLTTMFEQTGPPTTVLIETTALTVDDDLAHESGRWEYSYAPKPKLPARLGGRYLVVWRRQPDGSWKIHRDLRLPAKS